MTHANNKQSGFVSLFTVIFFILLITVITIGFLRIMIVEQRQALDSNLSASARAAAESGLEDGKRALHLYNTTGNAGLKANLATAFNGGRCNGLTGTPAIATALGLAASGNIINNNQINQSYSCLTVNLRTDEYLGDSQAGKSEFLPLRGVGAYDEVKISWHRISAAVDESGDGPVGAYPSGPLLFPKTNGTPAVDSWAEFRYAAYLRVQLYGYPNGNFNRAALEQRSRTVLLVPGNGFPAGSVNLQGADAVHGFNTDKFSPIMVDCSPSGYACSATLQMPTGAFSPANNTYYLRITPIYGQAHFQVQLYGGGSLVQMNEVQPIVDATGKAQDVLRRLQARVNLSPQVGLPEFVAESATDICKDMQVSSTVAAYVANCP